MVPRRLRLARTSGGSRRGALLLTAGARDERGREQALQCRGSLRPHGRHRKNAPSSLSPAAANRLGGFRSALLEGRRSSRPHRPPRRPARRRPARWRARYRPRCASAARCPRGFQQVSHLATAMTEPRRLAMPSKAGGACGKRATGGMGMISDIPRRQVRNASADPERQEAADRGGNVAPGRRAVSHSRR